MTAAAKPNPSIVMRREGHGAVVMCPYCGQEHRHGPAPGFRTAGCQPKGSEVGYFLMEPPAASANPTSVTAAPLPGPAVAEPPRPHKLNPWDHGDAMILADMGETFRIRVAKLLRCGHETGPCTDCWKRAKDIMEEALG